MDSEMILDFSDYSTANERILNKWKSESFNANPNDEADTWDATNEMRKKWRSTKKTTMSLWDLNDGCLNNILKYACTYGWFALNNENHWSMICTKFKEFYYKMSFKNMLHNIATTKIVSLNYDKKILDEIIERNINIVEVRGVNLSNSDLSAIDLFAGLKRLTLLNSRLTGKYINELTDLEELELEDIEGLIPKNLSLIFKNNELRVLKLLGVRGAFTEHLAYEINQNLMKQEGNGVQQLEELAIRLAGLDGWQALGSLRYLRKLEIQINNRPSSCEFQKCVFFFNTLSNNMNLQELQISNGIVTQDDLEILTILRNLKKLTINEANKLHLRDFCRFSHLTELHLLSMVAYMKEFLKILRDCPQLTIFTFKSIRKIPEVKIFAAINILNLQNRDKLPVRVEAKYYWRLNEFLCKHTDFLVIENPLDL